MGEGTVSASSGGRLNGSSGSKPTGALLVDNDIITSSTIWNYWTRLQSVGPFQAGFYEFQQNSSFDEAVAVLDQGPRPPELERVTIPEGLTVSEILPRLADPETGRRVMVGTLRDATAERARDLVERVVTALQVRTGPLYFQLILTDDGPRIVEIADIMEHLMIRAEKAGEVGGIWRDNLTVAYNGQFFVPDLGNGFGEGGEEQGKP